MKKTLIVLVGSLVFCSIIAGCKEKSEEEKIEELVEKMGEAKTEREAAEIADKIEKLEKRAEKKHIKEIIVKLGEPFSFWQHDQVPRDPPKKSEFRMIFKNPVVDEFFPYEPEFVEFIRGQRVPARRTPADQGKKYFGIVAKIENLGPRESSFERHIELKVDRGYIYRLGATGIVDDPEKDYPRTIYTLEPRKTGWLQLWCQIPEDTYPIEVFGKLGEGYFGAPGYTNFRLKLDQVKKEAPLSKKIPEREEEKRKLSESETRLLGKYTGQMNDGSQIFLELKKDGQVLLGRPWDLFIWAIRWVPKHGPHPPMLGLYKHNMDRARTVWFFQAGDGKREIETEPRPIHVNSLHFIDDIFRKHEEAKLIKLEKVWDWNGEVAYPHEVELWSKYIGKLGERIDERGKKHDRICLLELERIPNFTPSDWKGTREADGNGSLFEVFEWKIRDNKIAIYLKEGEPWELEIKGKSLVDKKNGVKLVKQAYPFPLPTSFPKPDEPESTPQPPSSVTPGLEEKEKLGQQINTKLETYSNKDSFPLPPISLTLRTTAPDLVEKVETIYFTALDYQFLSLRSLRFAKDFLNKGEVAKSKKYIEKADRYYKLATSLQRDSFSVLDSTYSVAQWMVAYKASRTALGFTATGLGIGASTLFDLGTLYTDYLLDKSTMPLEEAKKNLIAKAISNVLLRFTGTSEAVGDIVKHGWGSSRAFPVLQKIMGSSEFKDEVLKEFMRLGGDIGDYVAKETIEEVLARIIKGGIEEEPEKKEVEAEESLPLATREEFPETLPKVSLEPSPEGAKLITEAEQDLTAQPKRTISARDKLNKVLTMPLSNEQQSFVKKRLSELSSEWLFSEEVFASDALSTKYQVKPRESISSIARTNKVPYEILMEVNRIKHPRSVQAGKEIKLIHGPFHAIVYRSTFTMDLYLQKTFVRSFRVGLGQLGRETPTGLWRVKRDGKLIKPPSADPESGKLLRYGDPGYALGSRWIGLEGIKGAAKNRTGFGIHGTEELETIGAESSRGCIRLHDSDVIFVYNLLVPVHSLVEVVE